MQGTGGPAGNPRGGPDATVGSSFALLLGGRVFQGAGFGALFVTAFGVIATRFDGPERAKALGVLVACVGVVCGSGSLIGAC